jgi:hypothetical protein
MTLKGMVAQNVPFLGVERAMLRQKGNKLKSVKFHFNPTNVKFTKSVAFRRPPAPANSQDPPVQWTGSSPTKLTLDILLDGVRDQPFGSVLPEVEQLMAWTNPHGLGAGGAMSGLAAAMHGDVGGVISALGGGGGGGATEKADPPELEFVWGKLRINGATSFVGHLTSISVSYEMFARDGTPLRAKVNLSLESTSQNPTGTNPTSGAEKSDRRHVLRRGQSLQSVAYAVYGDAGRWRAIAAVNGIDDPFRIKAGHELLLPEPAELG